MRARSRSGRWGPVVLVVPLLLSGAAGTGTVLAAEAPTPAAPDAGGAVVAAEPSPAPSVLAPLPEPGPEPGSGVPVEGRLQGAETSRALGLPAVVAVVALLGTATGVVRVLLAEPAEQAGERAGEAAARGR